MKVKRQVAIGLIGMFALIMGGCNVEPETKSVFRPALENSGDSAKTKSQPQKQHQAPKPNAFRIVNDGYV
jgi:ABC-type uncharacterized transport system auxiliary subunit